ncbi:MAG: hypothetical protein H0U23_14770 [Blastocatellia bacterium]|nr:hypothetical protein [Blastocatellia bacterium]
MLDDHETALYDAFEAFAGALWSDEPVLEPEGTPVIERVMFDARVRGTADRHIHQRKQQ